MNLVLLKPTFQLLFIHNLLRNNIKTFLSQPMIEEGIQKKPLSFDNKKCQI